MTLDDGRVLRARAVVGADGSRSVVGRALGMPPATYAGYVAYRRARSLRAGGRALWERSTAGSLPERVRCTWRVCAVGQCVAAVSVGNNGLRTRELARQREERLRGLPVSMMAQRVALLRARARRGVARFDDGLPVPAQTVSFVLGSHGKRAGMIPLDDKHVYWCARGLCHTRHTIPHPQA